jgi:glutamate-ammonia-ligase adenylyltransferase
LQDRQCLVSLHHLGQVGLLDSQAVIELEDAYLFLRRVEHAIQALNDQQTQMLPVEPDLRQRMIDTLGYDSWNAFLAVLNEKRARVSDQFKNLIQEEVASPAETETQLELRLDAVLDDSTKNLIHEFWHGNALKNCRLKRCSV